MWVSGSCQVDGKKIGYWHNQQKGPVVVFLTGGPTNSAHLKTFVETFNPDFHFFGIDYPGRGLSDSFPGQNDFKNFGRILSNCLNQITHEEIILIGYSFGSAVAREIALTDIVKIKSLVLIQSGEFLPWFIKPILKLIFLPPRFSQHIRQAYWWLLCHPLHIFLDNIVRTSQLKDLLEQWNATLNYKIDYRVCRVPTLIMNSVKDQIIDGRSRKKIQRVFPNSQTVSTEEQHYFDLENKYFTLKSIFCKASEYYGMDILKELKT